jgi:hypothetical protein
MRQRAGESELLHFSHLLFLGAQPSRYDHWREIEKKAFKMTGKKW